MQATESFQGRTVVAKRVLLKFVSPPSAAKLAAVGAETAATYLEPLGGAGWYRLDSPRLSAAQLIAMFSADAGVAKVEPDYVGRPMAVRASVGDRR